MDKRELIRRLEQIRDLDDIAVVGAEVDDLIRDIDNFLELNEE